MLHDYVDNVPVWILPTIAKLVVKLYIVVTLNNNLPIEFRLIPIEFAYTNVVSKRLNKETVNIDDAYCAAIALISRIDSESEAPVCLAGKETGVEQQRQLFF